MGSPYLRGGIPIHVNESSGSAVQRWTWAQGVANYLWFKNVGAATITLSFSQADADVGRGVSVGSGEVWEGPAEISGFYVKSGLAQPFEAVPFIRRG